MSALEGLATTGATAVAPAAAATTDTETPIDVDATKQRVSMFVGRLQAAALARSSAMAVAPPVPSAPAAPPVPEPERADPPAQVTTQTARTPTVRPAPLGSPAARVSLTTWFEGVHRDGRRTER